MNVKAVTKPTEAKTTDAVDVVVQIADLVLAVKGAEKATSIEAIFRTTSRAAGLLPFKDRAERVTTGNSAAIQIARRTNLL
jgi:hypothetical protein